MEDVVIVGAGIAGLATALALKRAGVEALVLEGSEGLRATGAALTLFPNAWVALDALGISQNLASLYTPTKNNLLHEIKQRSSWTKISTPESLDNALADQLPINSIRFSSKLTAIETQEHEASISIIHMADGTVIKAKVLKGCDGMHSVVARVGESLFDSTLVRTCRTGLFRSISGSWLGCVSSRPWTGQQRATIYRTRKKGWFCSPH
ncbi:hypothetical protein ACE6H2_020441 [Prunus campanulata]